MINRKITETNDAWILHFDHESPIDMTTGHTIKTTRSIVTYVPCNDEYIDDCRIIRLYLTSDTNNVTYCNDYLFELTYKDFCSSNYINELKKLGTFLYGDSEKKKNKLVKSLKIDCGQFPELKLKHNKYLPNDVENINQRILIKKNFYKYSDSTTFYTTTVIYWESENNWHDKYIKDVVIIIWKYEPVDYTYEIIVG